MPPSCPGVLWEHLSAGDDGFVLTPCPLLPTGMGVPSLGHTGCSRCSGDLGSSAQGGEGMEGLETISGAQSPHGATEDREGSAGLVLTRVPVVPSLQTFSSLSSERGRDTYRPHCPCSWSCTAHGHSAAGMDAHSQAWHKAAQWHQQSREQEEKEEAGKAQPPVQLCLPCTAPAPDTRWVFTIQKL